MIIKKTKNRELVLTAGEDYVEAAERHYGKYTDRATYGITLRGNVAELWREEEGGRRAAIRVIRLADDEARRIREDMLRIKNFTGFGTLFFYLLGTSRGHAGQGL
jgi:hypothetical protein